MAPDSEARQTWQKAHPDFQPGQDVPPPDYGEAMTVAEEIAKGGYANGASQYLPDHITWLREKGYVGEADALEERIVKSFPGTDAATHIEGIRNRRAGLGKPIGLKFTDFQSGQEIDVEKDLAGKVVLIDFWATWCSPCVADMPAMKALYEKYRERGFEIIMVSLDQPPEAGGKDALTRYLAENPVPWPIYYQGSARGEFNTRWGVSGIPRHFIIGPDGQIRNLDTHRAAESEPIVRTLLDERDQKQTE